MNSWFSARPPPIQMESPNAYLRTDLADGTETLDFLRIGRNCHQTERSKVHASRGCFLEIARKGVEKRPSWQVSRRNGADESDQANDLGNAGFISQLCASAFSHDRQLFDLSYKIFPRRKHSRASCPNCMFFAVSQPGITHGVERKFHAGGHAQLFVDPK